MCDWVDFIKATDDINGGRRLWTTGFHYGDWLALDGGDPNSSFGGTPEDFIASAFYYYSTRLVARAAVVLEKTELATQYKSLAEEILAAIQNEFFTATGRLAIHTQTGFVVALFMNLVPAAFRSRIINDLISRLRKDDLHLRTGFVGTPYLCRALSNWGANEMAYQLLLNEDHPSWLYAVNLGATTIWERWDSIKPDGMLSSTRMNSFNHYAYGSIVEWMYRDMCGLNPSSGNDSVTGFHHACIAPKPDKSLQWARASYQSAAGLFERGWLIGEDGDLFFEFTIPFNAVAHVILPDAKAGEILINGEQTASGIQEGDNVTLQLDSGLYRIKDHPSQSYIKTFSIDTPVVQILQNKKAKSILQGFIPIIAKLNEEMIAAIGEASLREIATTPYLTLTYVELDAIDQALNGIRIESELQ